MGCVIVGGDGWERHLRSTETELMYGAANRDYSAIERAVVEFAQRNTLDLLDVIRSQPLWIRCVDYGVLCMDDIDCSFRQFARGVYGLDELVLQLHKNRINRL